MAPVPWGKNKKTSLTVQGNPRKLVTVAHRARAKAPAAKASRKPAEDPSPAAGREKLRRHLWLGCPKSSVLHSSQSYCICLPLQLPTYAGHGSKSLDHIIARLHPASRAQHR